MKNILILIIAIVYCNPVKAQESEIKTVFVNEHVSTHFICSEPVQYVDISTENVAGDMPLPNVVRIRPHSQLAEEYGVVTIIAEQYLVQFQMKYSDVENANTQVFINQTDGRNLMLPQITLTHEEMETFSKEVLKQKARKPKQKKKANGVEARLNQIYSFGDFYLVDLSFRNKTNIPYTIDQIRFKIEDKTITKATNIQSIEIEPKFQLFDKDGFENRYRNVFVFDKFTFPNRKIFTIEMTEKQISGRNITLKIDYQDILKADVL